MPLGYQCVTYGNVQSTFVLSATLTPVATAATTAAEQSFTIPGLLVGDQVSDVSLSTAFPNTLLSIENCRVSANNTLTIAFQNGTAGSLTYPSGTYLIEINRPLAGSLAPIIQ